MKDRVDFNITNNGISVGANVTRDYFEDRVLPLITILLGDMASPQKRRAASRRAARPEPKESRVGVLTIKALEQRPAATRAVAIRSYTHKPSVEKRDTHIFA